MTPAATVPSMATAVSEQVASGSTYTALPEPMPCRYEDGYHRPAAAVYMTWIHGYGGPEPGYTMPTPGFTSLSGLRGPQSCGGRSRGSGRSSNKYLPAGTDVLRRDQPTTSHRTSRHHSKSRTALAILTTKLSTATQARRPHDPQNTARYGARQAGRHEHEQRTTELEQHPGAPMGSTGTRQGGPTGPCHRRGVYI